MFRSSSILCSGVGLVCLCHGEGFYMLIMQHKDILSLLSASFSSKLLWEPLPASPNFSDYHESRIRTKQSSQVHNLLLQFDGQKVAVSFFKTCLLWSSFSLQPDSSLFTPTWIEKHYSVLCNFKHTLFFPAHHFPYTRLLLSLTQFHSHKVSDVVYKFPLDAQLFFRNLKHQP